VRSDCRADVVLVARGGMGGKGEVRGVRGRSFTLNGCAVGWS
jgi:hypothetical protein